jgi:hypothetical protein
MPKHNYLNLLNLIKTQIFRSRANLSIWEVITQIVTGKKLTVCIENQDLWDCVSLLIKAPDSPRGEEPSRGLEESVTNLIQLPIIEKIDLRDRKGAVDSAVQYDLVD